MKQTIEKNKQHLENPNKSDKTPPIIGPANSAKDNAPLNNPAAILFIESSLKLGKSFFKIEIFSEINGIKLKAVDNPRIKKLTHIKIKITWLLIPIISSRPNNQRLITVKSKLKKYIVFWWWIVPQKR